MGVLIENTPNPKALKFTVGMPVGGPATFTDPATADPKVGPILNVAGVRSIFMTADFVTVTRTDEGEWESIAPQVSSILESAFG